MDWSTLLVQATVNGMVVGLLYLLMAVGFTLVFGVMRIVNFAHGEFYMLGAFAAYFITAKAGLPFLATLAVTFIGAVVLGILLEVLVLKPFRQDELNGMITTIGLAMIVQNLALMVFGPDPLSMPAIVRGVTRMGGVVIPTSRLYVVGFALAVLVLLYVFLKHSRPGRALRAVAGLVSPAGGSIRFDGKDITAVNPAVRVRDGISLSPEGRRLFGRMTVLDNLLTGAYTVSSASVIKSTLDEIYGLFPRVRERRHQLAGSLSGGEQQMVAIGRALMAQPRLLMLDEPSLGIAPKVVAEIAHAIQRINRDKKISVILVEQNARLALRLSHNAYALEHGEVVRSGCGDELLADPFVQKAYLGV